MNFWRPGPLTAQVPAPTFKGLGPERLEMSMEPLAYAGPRGPVPPYAASRLGLKGLAWIGGLLATICALGVAAILALFVAATVVVLGLMSAALIGLGGLAYRARKTVKRNEDPNLLEARHIGGHSWVAYGWDRRGR
jgi:hypothetical protein